MSLIEPSNASRAHALVAIRALSSDDEAALRRAVAELASSSLAMRLTTLLGRQIGAVGFVLPDQMTEVVNRSAEAAIRAAMGVALRTLPEASRRDSRRLHKSLVTLAGAAGGSLGLAGLPVELPFTTTLMLRSIAEIARNEGEELSDPDVGLACLEVFALSDDVGRGLGASEGAPEAGYFAVRVLLAKMVSQSARHFMHRGLSEQAAPLLARLISQISARFGLLVSQKLAAQAVPLIGAASGAAINYAFVDHFQTLARGHFTIRRLERRYGPNVVRAEYEKFAAAR
ncbi:EcsC family protein [Methylocella sp.]|uniref:EcsC family protein n=1 Tax=Methylocella sp. TaxID=1978226 RepID=UPI003784F026